MVCILISAAGPPNTTDPAFTLRVFILSTVSAKRGDAPSGEKEASSGEQEILRRSHYQSVPTETL
jgi:hypothetical protein